MGLNCRQAKQLALALRNQNQRFHQKAPLANRHGGLSKDSVATTLSQPQSGHRRRFRSLYHARYNFAYRGKQMAAEIDGIGQAVASKASLPRFKLYLSNEKDAGSVAKEHSRNGAS